MRNVVASLALLLLASPAVTHAEEAKKEVRQKYEAAVETRNSVLLGFQGYGRYGGTSSLSMECHTGESPSNIKCDFTWLGIQVENVGGAQKLAEARATFEAAPESELLKNFGPSSELQGEEDREESLMAAKAPHKLSPEQAHYWDRHLRMLREAEKCSTKPCIIAQLVRSLEEEQQTCLLLTDRFTLEFTQTAPNKWVSAQAPKGLCHPVRVATLESEPHDGFLWTFTESVASRDSDPGCESIELNKPIIYSWRAPTQFDLSCQVFGWSHYGLLPSDLVSEGGAGATSGRPHTDGP